MRRFRQMTRAEQNGALACRVRRQESEPARAGQQSHARCVHPPGLVRPSRKGLTFPRVLHHKQPPPRGPPRAFVRVRASGARTSHCVSPFIPCCEVTDAEVPFAAAAGTLAAQLSIRAAVRSSSNRPSAYSSRINVAASHLRARVEGASTLNDTISATTVTPAMTLPMVARCPPPTSR